MEINRLENMECLICGTISLNLTEDEVVCKFCSVITQGDPVHQISINKLLTHMIHTII